MSNKIKTAIIALLLIILTGLGYYSYTNNKKHELVKTTMQNDQDKLINDLSEMEASYTDEIAKNTTLYEELSIQKDEVTKLIDSIKRVKNTSWRASKYLKNKISKLQALSNKYKALNDSLIQSNEFLNSENLNLNEENRNLTTNIEEQTTYSNTLLTQNEELARKVAIGEMIKISNMHVLTYRTRRNKLRETDRAKKVDVFKVSFTLNENQIAANRNITAYVNVIKPSGELLLDRGVFTTSNNVETHYSDKSSIPYKKENITKSVLIKFGDLRLEKGTYLIDLYTDNTKVGTVKKVLN